MDPTLLPAAAQPRHPIRVVAQRTGLTPATLRAWERRYGVVEPYRSEGGQRLYSDQDVERLIRLHLLSEGGRPIGLVAALSDEEAEALLQEDRGRRLPVGSGEGTPLADAPTGRGSTEREAHRFAEAAYRSVVGLDGEGLERTLRKGAVTLGAHRFLESLVAPLLHRVGTAWTRRELGPAQEHLCTAVTEQVLAWLTEPVARGADGPRLVVATLSGERHGLGARLVVAAAGLEGWRVTHLGVDLPAGEIAEAARAQAADAVALSMVNGDTVGHALAALAELREALPDGTPVLLGGAQAGRLEAAALPDRVQVVDGLGGLRRALSALA